MKDKHTCCKDEDKQKEHLHSIDEEDDDTCCQVNPNKKHCCCIDMNEEE